MKRLLIILGSLGSTLAVTLLAGAASEPTPSAAEIYQAQAHVYDLARESRHAEVVAAVGELEKAGAVPLPLQMQRLYSLSALGQNADALARAEQLLAAHPESGDLVLLRSELLFRLHRGVEGARSLHRLNRDAPETPAGKEAAARLRYVPAIWDPERLWWGEAYTSGDYLGRYGTVLGSGFIRQGLFVPGLRQLQPYVEYRFGVDTRSGAGRRETIVADNAVAFSAGARAQVFETEYLFVYGQAGVNKDLLDRREDGNAAFDYQTGVYGFKSWGPGTVLRVRSEPTGAAPGGGAAGGGGTGLFLWRADWFADVGADFSYYRRYHDAIGYGQAHEGLRMFQVGSRLAGDLYLLQDLSWDVRGNFFDNAIDIGPGGRLVWMPGARWQVVLRAEWVYGTYFGRDEQGTRGNASSRYDGVHVGLAVGARW